MGQRRRGVIAMISRHGVLARTVYIHKIVRKSEGNGVEQTTKTSKEAEPPMTLLVMLGAVLIVIVLFTIIVNWGDWSRHGR